MDKALSINALPLLMPALMIMAAASDVTSFRIPNWLTGLAALLFFPVALIMGMPLAELQWHIVICVILFVAGYALFALRLFGGGDAKLMAVAGLWLGTSQTANFLILTALAGGFLVLVICALALMQFFASTSGVSFGKAVRNLAPRVPYGFALAVGAILAFPGSWWMNHAV
jgi:prepilin peptidase CpaA